MEKFSKKSKKHKNFKQLFFPILLAILILVNIIIVPKFSRYNPALVPLSGGNSDLAPVVGAGAAADVNDNNVKVKDSDEVAPPPVAEKEGKEDNKNEDKETNAPDKTEKTNKPNTNTEHNGNIRAGVPPTPPRSGSFRFLLFCVVLLMVSLIFISIFLKNENDRPKFKNDKDDKDKKKKDKKDKKDEDNEKDDPEKEGYSKLPEFYDNI